jgi:hypothetical protein
MHVRRSKDEALEQPQHAGAGRGPERLDLLSLQRLAGNRAVNWALAHPDFGGFSVQRAVIYDSSGAPLEVDDSAVSVGPDGQWRGPNGQVLILNGDGSFHEAGPAMGQTSGGPQSASGPGADAGAPDAGAADAGQADASMFQSSSTGATMTDGGAPPVNAPSSGLSSTGATSTEVPASYAVGGLPAFRYNLPRAPIASTHLETPTASIDLELSLIGNVSVTFPNPPRGISTDVDTGGWRVEATNAVGGITEGLRINGIGTATPSIGATIGNQYDQTEVRFTPPNTIAFRGQARIGYSKASPLGQVAVQGQPGFELRVTVTPHPTTGPEPDPVLDEEDWFERHREPLAVLGVVALVALAIALAPETGGGSLVLLAT